MKKVLAITIILLVLAVSTIAMSPNEATDLVSKTNNYLISGETATILSPQVQLMYKGTNYWVIAGTDNGNTGVYIPVKTNGTIASGSIEVRELIKTEIVLSRMYSLKNSYPVGDWPFSYPQKTQFFDLQSAFNNLSPSIGNVESDLKGINTAGNLRTLATNIKTGVEDLSVESKDLAQIIDGGITFEKAFYAGPDTNETAEYENQFDNFFAKEEAYKTHYTQVNSDLDALRQGIGSFQGSMSNDQKQFYLSVLKMPQETAALNSFFNNTDSTKALVEEVFASGRSIENLVLNLETRSQRNDAWKVIYGYDEAIVKLNSSFGNLSDAAEGILLTTNVDYWNDTASVEALKVNWKQTKTKYDTGIYDKAITFGNDAKKNVKSILEKGFIVPDTTSFSNNTVMIIIVVLIILLVGVFLFQKFYVQKKKGGEEYDKYEEK